MVTQLLIFLLLGTPPAPAKSGATRVNEVFVQLKSPKASSGTEKWQLAEADVNEFVAVAISSRKRLGLTKMLLDFDASGTLRSTAVINMDDVKLDSAAVRAFKTFRSGVHTLQAKGRLVVRNKSRARFRNPGSEL